MIKCVIVGFILNIHPLQQIHQAWDRAPVTVKVSVPQLSMAVFVLADAATQPWRHASEAQTVAALETRSEVLDDEGYVHRGSKITQLERRSHRLDKG